MDRCAKIRRLIYKLRYILVFKIDNKTGYFQADLNLIYRLPELKRFSVMKMDLQNQQHIDAWKEIVSDAYGEEIKDCEREIRRLINHPFLHVTDTILIMEQDKAIATVSLGTYKESPHIGGLLRIAIRSEYQGIGLGKYCVLLGYNILYERGIRYGESIVASQRNSSIMTHYACGFKHQNNMKYITYKGALENINFIQKFRIRLKLDKMYKEYLKKSNERFISNYIGTDNL